MNNYREYLKSGIWKEKKKELFDYYRSLGKTPKCSHCGVKRNLQVHHKTYERVGCEDLKDLEVLCGFCHQKTHGLIDLSSFKVIKCSSCNFLGRRLTKKQYRKDKMRKIREWKKARKLARSRRCEENRAKRIREKMKLAS